MASYNAKDILAQLESKGKTGSTGQGESRSKLNYWKCPLGEHEVRFLPYASQDGKHCPFQEVNYYEKLSDRRLVAPLSFDLPDPVKEAFEKLRRQGKEGWAIAKQLQAKPRYYAVVMVRGEEDKGPQIWEFSRDMRNQIFGILTHKDNVDEDMFSPETGYDFTINVKQAMDNGKPRTFNGNVVKDVTVTPRKKPSKLSPRAAEAEKWLKAMPKLDEIFRSQVKEEEELVELLENFIEKLSSSPTAAATSTTEATTPSVASSQGTNHTAARGANVATASVNEAKLKDAFGLDTE